MAGPNAPYTQLDDSQVIRQSFDETTDRLRVDAEITATIGVLEVEIDAADGDNIAISDGVNNVTISTEGAKYALDVKLAGDNVVQLEGQNGNTIEPNADGSIKTIQLLTRPYSGGTETYPSATQEVITTSLSGGATPVERVTINYTDATKNNLSSFQREYWNGSMWIVD